MTSPQVSEAELQHAIDAYDAVITHAADVTHFITSATRREAFRAALTAAAQVREKQKEQQASLVQATTEPAETSRDHPSIEKPAAWQTLVRGRWCNLPEDWDSTENRSDQTYRPLFAHAIQPTLMPIYGATEPDSGPDVLGEKP